ncbi:hypothetical protein TNCV_4923511 [Trichonephila clavipes]|nr:hypothetical protein TNCV_4923511 [Trichonephila clavipes]
MVALPVGAVDLLSTFNMMHFSRLTSAIGDLTYFENSDMLYMYGCENSNGRAALRMYHAQLPDRRMPDHRIFQRLHRQFRGTR